ncbi:MAG: Malate dehydrogenase (oxaloacetate decarboxylating) [Nitrospirae bacterium]|nr:Malate dehydrogenase (oxaloacetate decarboxylating) [Nitrospirota bacterium]
MITTPSPSYSITVRLEIANQVGMFGKIATTIGETAGDIGAVDIVRAGKGFMVRDFTINARDEAHEKEIVDAIRKISGVRVIHVTDRTFLQHLGGKIEIHPKVPVKNRNDLSRIYTPGVARVCSAIWKESEKAYRFTIKRNTVGIITDGSAVLGLGNIGPLAALPVMEGKAMLFKEFAHIDAFPICLATTDTEEIIQTVKNIAPVFGGINLEDISAPRCFEIEGRLKSELDIPVFHDDQHGTAVVTLAALLNAVTLVGKNIVELKVVISGAGAAGTACCRIMKEVGISNIIVCDREGIIYRGRQRNMNQAKLWIAENTNPETIHGRLRDAMDKADVFIGVSVPGILSVSDIKRMSSNPIVFALANPEPEIAPEEASSFVRILATGRSDYPNQINNMLCFPGLFRGLLDSRAKAVNEEIKLAAANAIASCVDQRDLSEDYIVPSIFDRKVVAAVTAAVVDTAVRTGVSGKER